MFAVTENNNAKETKSKPRRLLADKVYHSLFSRISNGDYPVNQRLPSEHQLSEEFGVSRPVLRSALEKLRKEGVIYARQGAGNYVRAPSVSPVGFARVETLADIQRCYEFRLNLETTAAVLAAERHNTAIMADLEDALELMRTATGSQIHREDADFAFHIAIAKATNNHYFEAAMRALREHIYVGMQMHGQSLLNEGGKALAFVFEEHLEISNAIRARDGALASKLMRSHLEHSRDRLFGGGLINLKMPDPS
ncbi:GntR family transcriptional regulator, transcriptional repressor for pyruvate dehydrogenase complex [Cohaesibacter sp. ES.047]|uniref:FadR/GntR family transcriptional regulator n=1 Tax=Cohaesibacter sp. ES.047 TaxID=1798205 RepID=UPI000BB703EB|nr:GntR family transcriptional regulator, transcriptional repressor for pyruvate dehydrogenase complex [Cohaesibacter sp. ES.047]